MALAPINPTQITPPRVNLIDERSGAISREWYRFFLSLLTATQTNQDVIELSPDTAALLASYDAMLADLAQTTETQPDCCASGQAVLTSDIQGLSLTPTAAAISALAVTQSDIQSLALAPPGNNGSVTSVDASGGATGLTFSGGPITTSGTLTLGGTLAITNGGTGAITATAARTNLGASTLGSNVFTITNPSAVTFPRFNADNTVSALDAATFRTAIGAGTGSGSVTSVSGTGTVNGITLTGTVTSSGSLTLGGTLSGVSLTTQVSGTLPIANGGTNGTATPTAGGVAYGTGTAYAVNSAGTSGQVLTSAGAGAPTWTTPTTGTVTSVTGTAPVVSSGGSTPAISMAAATASVNGYLTSTDWTTFNNKGSGSVTSVSGTGTVNGITLTGTVTSSGSLTLGGTLSGVSLTTQVSGTLPVANGGTGVTTSTGTVAVVLSNTPTLVTPILGVASATSIATGLGLVGTPAYTFTGDLNTGMWSPAADTVAFSTAGVERLRVSSAGDVGIGTTAPTAQLHIYNAANATLLLESGGAGAPIISMNTTGVGQQRITANTGSAQNMAFEVASAERMRIIASGDVLIGTSSSVFFSAVRTEIKAPANLHANVAIVETTAYVPYIAWNQATTGDNNFVAFGTEASYTGRGTISYNRIAGLVAYNTTSDYRAKEVFGPVENPGATIDSLKVYTGKMLGATQSRPMLIAHEAQEITPYAVTGEKDAINKDGKPNYQQMDVSALVPLLIAEVQSLRTRVAQLEGK